MDNDYKFKVEDYEYISDLIDEALEKMDKPKMDMLTALKGIIYKSLMADGLQKEADNVMKKKWDIDEKTGRVIGRKIPLDLWKRRT